LQVKQVLQQTADKDLKIESETPVNEPGDFVDGFSLWFGHGKVNAARAVKSALPEAEITIDQEVQAGLEIPDAGSPIFSKIEIFENGAINDIRIALDLTHTYMGDLRIDVTAPDGTAVTLHDHKGNSTDNIHMVYTVSELPALRAFVGKSIQGTWIIGVVDNWKMDVGRLNSWRLLAKVATSSS
jgi:subtilisin-like proprotein convertase family protein